MTGRGPGPLDGFVVVGLEHSVAGPLCTRILADLGAEVIKIERGPGGDFARHWDDNVAGESAQFWWLNRRKRSIVLDLKEPVGRRSFDELLERADVLVCNLSPGALDRLGLTPEELGSRYPSLVTCQISGYGRTGEFRDRKAYDMLVQAEAGVMSLTGSPETPSRAGVSVSDVGTGIYGAVLVLAGLLGRMKDGKGRHLDVAMYDATVEFAAPMLLSYLNAGLLYPRFPDRHHAIVPYGVFRCADGVLVLVAVEHDHEWQRFAEAILQRPELADDPGYATNIRRLERREEVDAMVAAAIGALPSGRAYTLLDSLGLAYASLNDLAAVGNHSVVRERGMLANEETAAGVGVRTLVGLGERVYERDGAGHDRPRSARTPRRSSRC